MSEKCGVCGRIDPSPAECGSFITCPIKPADKGKVTGREPILPTDVLLDCEPCGIHRALPVGKITKGASMSSMGIHCQREECVCVPSVIASSKAPPTAAETKANKSAPKATATKVAPETDAQEG